jgi:hypothetical protein
MNLMQGVAELIPHFGIKASCSQLNVPRASYNRWRAGRNATPAARRNVRSRPPRSLDDSEIKQVEETLNSERFADQSPRAVYAALLDEEKGASDFCVGRVKNPGGYETLWECKTKNFTKSCSA